MDKILKYTIAIGIIIIALSFAYYLVVFLPKKEAMRQEPQNQDTTQSTAQKNDEKQAQINDLEKKAESFRQMIELKQNKAQVLQEQLDYLNSQLDRSDLSSQDRENLLEQKDELLKQTKEEEVKYQELLKRVEQQKRELLGDISSIAQDSNQDTVNKYGGEVLQVGGIGSRITQKTAYPNTGDQGYFSRAEDWVLSSFNSPADLMWVDCRDGYEIISCKLDDKKNEINDTFGCGVLIKDKINNRVNIECVKK